jgi:hypothetical protein
MYLLGGKEPKEPKDPPLITRFLKTLKNDSTYKLSPTSERQERAMNLAKKKFMSSDKLEDNIDSKAKEFYKNKRLSLKLR